MTNRQTDVEKLLIYTKDFPNTMRLSEKAILTQKEMLENYARQNGFANIVHYTDDGQSGGNFERLAWKQMIDEEAAAVVKRIFRLSIEGYGIFQIAKILHEDKIPTPAVHFVRQGRGTRGKRPNMEEPYDRSSNTVGKILQKPEYMGHTVNFRSYKEHYKDKRRIMKSPDEWLIFENTHEAIVDKETWELAQKARKFIRRTDTTGVANPSTGLVYCADCGERMYNHRGIHKMKKCNIEINPGYIEYPYDFYECATYTKTASRTNKKCVGHHISSKSLETLKTVSKSAIENEVNFTEKVLREIKAAIKKLLETAVYTHIISCQRSKGICRVKGTGTEF